MCVCVCECVCVCVCVSVCVCTISRFVRYGVSIITHINVLN